MKFLFLLSIIYGILLINGCQVPCSTSSDSCCIRQSCGCVDTLGTTSGCDGPCTDDNPTGECKSDDIDVASKTISKKCPAACNSESLACCVIKKRCGCSDLGAYLDSGGSEDDCRKQCACP